MYRTPDGSRIEDDDQYMAPNGTQYPHTFPKGEINGLLPITTAAAPSITKYQTLAEGPLEFVGGAWRQTWIVTNWTAEQIAASLAAAKTALILKIDVDTDAIYGTVMGNRASEYAEAEREAKEYKNAGYTGTVPGTVQSWANAKVWTSNQATDDIIATATAWRNAQASIRTNRLGKKEAARNAASGAALDTVAGQWNGFVAAIRTALGI